MPRASKLSPSEQATVAHLAAEGVHQRDLAATYDVSQSIISKIVNRARAAQAVTDGIAAEAAATVQAEEQAAALKEAERQARAERVANPASPLGPGPVEMRHSRHKDGSSHGVGPPGTPLVLGTMRAGDYNRDRWMREKEEAAQVYAARAKRRGTTSPGVLALTDDEYDAHQRARRELQEGNLE